MTSFLKPVALAALPLVAFALATLTAPAAHAQATGNVNVSAQLRITTPTGVTVNFTAGSAPVTSYVAQGTGLPNINYSNSTNTTGITTSVQLDPTTGSGPGFNRAQTTLLFTPTLTLSNTTNALVTYTYQYSVPTFSTSVNATPNSGTALSSESISFVLSETNAGTLSNFSQSLSRTNGSASATTGPSAISGTLSIAAQSTVTLSLRTNISVDDQYNPTVAAAAPEPGSIVLLLTAGVPVVGLVSRRAKRRSGERLSK